MRRLGLLAVLLALAGCGSWNRTDYRELAPCSSAGTCPPGQRCTPWGLCARPCTTAACTGADCVACGSGSYEQGMSWSCVDGFCELTCAANQGCSSSALSCDYAIGRCRLGCSTASSSLGNCPADTTCTTQPVTSGAPSGPVCHYTGPSGDGGVTDGAWTAPDAGGTVKPIVLDGAGSTTMLYVDNSTDGGGWVLVGQVSVGADMWNQWLRTNSNVASLQAPVFGANIYACVDAVWYAVNRASEIRLSNEDLTRWVKWPLPADRSTATLWNHAAGQVTISAAPQSSVTVTAWDGSTADCYQNAFGILPFYQHGGSYPATAINPSGNTSSGDLCMAVGVVKPGTAADGFTQNGNGFDAPANDGDWPNSVTGPPPYVNVWLR